MRDLEAIYATFPASSSAATSLAGYASGGEQQMCAIGRAMMSRPKFILLDEPSMGLAPQVVEEIFEIVRGLNERRGSRSCSPSRTPISRCATRASAIFWKPAGSCSTARPGRSRQRRREGILSRRRRRGPALVQGCQTYKRRKRWLA